MTPYTTAAHADVANKTDSLRSTVQYEIELGAGAIVKPKYPGADSYLVSPFPIFGVGRFYVPGLGQVVEGEEMKRGLFFYPSFDVNGERKASDSADLTGTDKVDWAVEVGVGGGYRHDWLRGFVELRQGFNGHEGQVAEFGLDFIATPMERVELFFGPRASWASNDYMDTYFGVTPDEASADGSMLSAFNADAGFKTVGLAGRVRYDWTEQIALHLRGEWDHFIGDAADSPIVKAGSINQFSIGVGMSYKFAFDLFD
ncbi:MAG: MipA/OmpV family protein [Anderseniella sp.]|jgi:outer membrane scaffolding protein for murein synthesis (MipA/OmpV family)|nr:MipA/OmpV family protein [Anderseniella sp.]